VPYNSKYHFDLRRFKNRLQAHDFLTFWRALQLVTRDEVHGPERHQLLRSLYTHIHIHTNLDTHTYTQTHTHTHRHTHCRSNIAADVGRAQMMDLWERGGPPGEECWHRWSLAPSSFNVISPPVSEFNKVIQRNGQSQSHSFNKYASFHSSATCDLLGFDSCYTCKGC